MPYQQHRRVFPIREDKIVARVNENDELIISFHLYFSLCKITHNLCYVLVNGRVATGNPVVFTLSPPECYMEIRNGYGIAGSRVTGPVRVGDPLTLMIYMRSKYDGFDIVVNDCYAHNGANKRIQLIDEYG